MFLRNQFKGKDKYEMPVIPKADLSFEELDGLRLIGFDKAKTDSNGHYSRMVHFFLYDYKFEDIWAHPDKYVERMKKYKAMLTPDFSIYIEMHPVMQLYNTFRNRWAGAYFAEQGIKIIPTVNWGLENTFDFCFNGIEKGSAVAVSTYMVSEHGNHSDQKEFFMKGYNEMLRRIEPSVIICYHYPFPEMEGNIVFVDYDLSSWTHDNDDIDKTCLYTQSERYLLGFETPPPESHVIIKRCAYVNKHDAEKGMGSVEGGEWQPKPNKPEEQRFIGKPGETKITYDKKGNAFQTKIGNDGRAEKERHNTDHNRAHSGHTDPHDHIIDWNKGFPDLGESINYPSGAAPEFKMFKGIETMEEFYLPSGDLKFSSISEFKWSLKCNSEIEFMWNGKAYTILPLHPGFNIGEGYYTKDGIHYNTEDNTACEDIIGADYDTPEKLLNHAIDGQKLREIITQIDVIYRFV